MQYFYTTIFELQNAIGKRDIALSMQIVERMLELGESPQRMIIMLTRFFTQLAKLVELRQKRASEQQMASEMGIKPYFVKQYIGFSTNFTMEHIEQNFRALLDADVADRVTGGRFTEQIDDVKANIDGAIGTDRGGAAS